MEKLFLVWYVTGHIVFTAGPLPYGEEECQKVSLETYEYVIQKDREGVFVGLEIRCEWHEERPILSEEELFLNEEE